MGILRKALFAGTAGIIRPNSKKQRMSKKQLKELRKQTEILRRATEK